MNSSTGLAIAMALAVTAGASQPYNNGVTFLALPPQLGEPCTNAQPNKPLKMYAFKRKLSRRERKKRGSHD